MCCQTLLHTITVPQWTFSGCMYGGPAPEPTLALPRDILIQNHEGLSKKKKKVLGRGRDSYACEIGKRPFSKDLATLLFQVSSTSTIDVTCYIYLSTTSTMGDSNYILPAL